MSLFDEIRRSNDASTIEWQRRALTERDREIEDLHGDRDRLLRIVREQDAEREVLMRERDNALLRVEELEADACGPDCAGRIEDYRGGVHPNA